MIRKLVSVALLALLVVVAFASADAALWGRKFLGKQLLQNYLGINKEARAVFVRAWSAPITLSFWDEDGNQVAPVLLDTGAAAWSAGDTVATIAPGDWEQFDCQGMGVRGLYLRTLNAYSTWDSNATAVSLEVW